MMNPENWILGRNKNSCQVFFFYFSISLVQHVLSRLSTFYISEEQVYFFIALFLSVLNPIDDFLSLLIDDFYFLFFRIDLQRIIFWVN